MKVEPSAADLLDVARATLIAEIAPALDEPRRYAVLMAANALAIVGRELAAPASASEELARVAALLPDWDAGGEELERLREGTSRLAARIRLGQFDEADARRKLLEHLRETVRTRLSVSNPRALPGARRTAP